MVGAVIAPRITGPRRWRLGLSVLAFQAACSRTVDVNVELVDPCNQSAVASMKYLKFEPRGDGIVDSEGLGTSVDAASGEAPAIRIPLVNNFQLVATGVKVNIDDPPDAIGISAKRDLANVSGPISIRVPFALLGSFYRTTELERPKTCSALLHARHGASATYLPSSGKVLIVGGASIIGDRLEYPRQIELYDPSTGAFTAASELPVGSGRAFHTATLLSDGRVLVAGGEGLVMTERQTLKSAVLIDPRNLGQIQVSSEIQMRDARQGHTAAALADGRVVIAAGEALVPGMPTQYLKSIEVFDPDRGVFSVPVDATGKAIELTTSRFAHSGTLLKTGYDVLLAGGIADPTTPLLTLEAIHAEPQGAISVKPVSDTLGVGPIAHAAVLASNGAVLLSGGYATIGDAFPTTGMPVHASANVEMWNFDGTGAPTKGCAAAMAVGRGFHTASVVGRRVVFVGGRGPDGSMLSNGEVAELLGVGPACFAQPPEVDNMTDARSEHAAVVLPSGEILVVGGRQQLGGADPFGHSIDSAEVYSPARVP